MALLNKSSKNINLIGHARAQNNPSRITSNLRSSVSVRALSVALMTVGVMSLSGTEAQAACVETSINSGVWECTGAAATVQVLTASPGGALVATTTSPFSINAATGTALTLSNTVGGTSITFTDANNSTIKGDISGIVALNQGTGVLSITTGAGAVTGTTVDGIRAENTSAGTDLTVTTGDGDVTGATNGINGRNFGSGCLEHHDGCRCGYRQ